MIRRILKVFLFTLLYGAIAFAEHTFEAHCVGQPIYDQPANCLSLCRDKVERIVQIDNVGYSKLICTNYPYWAIERSTQLVESHTAEHFGVALKLTLNYESFVVDCVDEKVQAALLQGKKLALDTALFQCVNPK